MIVAFDGPDGVGKETQSALLADYLNQSGKPTQLISLPDYTNTTGQAIKKYLAGDMQWLSEADSYMAASLFAANRSECLIDLFRFKDWQNVVFNRYVLSNAAYQSFRFATGDEQRKFADWVLDLEFNKFKLPRPDLTIILDLPIDEAIKQIQKRQGNHRDIHEKNIQMLEYCRETYLSMAWQKVGGLKYYVVDCFDHNNGGVRSIESIHDEVTLVVERLR